MSSKYLGQPFDIHGGGRDLVFPHHENEIAQAEGICGCKFVNYWIHNGFININAEKMSKSLGNIKTIREILSLYDHETIRYFLLSNHYRSSIDYTEENLSNAERAVISFYASLEHIVEAAKQCDDSKKVRINEYEQDLVKAIEDYNKEFKKSMDDDFNTVSVIGSTFDLLREVNGYVIDKKKQSSQDAKAKIAGLFIKRIRADVSKVIGIFGSDYDEYQMRQRAITSKRLNLDVANIESLVLERSKARKDKDFSKADSIRNKLDEMQVEVKDRPDGTSNWFVKI